MSTGNYGRFPAGRLISSPVRIHSWTENSYPRSLHAVIPALCLSANLHGAMTKEASFVRPGAAGRPGGKADTLLQW